MKIIAKNYLYYKLLNSIFAGMAMGAIFALYGNLDPMIFSVGGIFLALGVWLIATQYQRILNVKIFFKFSIIVELITLITTLLVILFSHSNKRSFFYYIAYQLIFIFGQYLFRAETIFLKKRLLIKLADIRKQQGYLLGLTLSTIFYTLLKKFGITTPIFQSEKIHYLLLVVQLLTITFLYKSFTRPKESTSH